MKPAPLWSTGASDSSIPPNERPSQYGGNAVNCDARVMSVSTRGDRLSAPQPPAFVDPPAGRQSGELLPGAPFVSHVRQLPSVAIEYSSGLSPSGKLRSLENTMRVPSGDQSGALSSPVLRVRRRRLRPFA